METPPPVRASMDRRENLFLRWLVGGGLFAIMVLGGIVWTRVAAQGDQNTKDITAQALQIQRLDLDSASDRRATAVALQAITAWLQAIGQRLDVRQPPPAIGATP